MDCPDNCACIAQLASVHCTQLAHFPHLTWGVREETVLLDISDSNITNFNELEWPALQYFDVRINVNIPCSVILNMDIDTVLSNCVDSTTTMYTTDTPIKPNQTNYNAIIVLCLLLLVLGVLLFIISMYKIHKRYQQNGTPILKSYKTTLNTTDEKNGYTTYRVRV